VVWSEDNEIFGAAWARRVEPVAAREGEGAVLREVVVAVAEDAVVVLAGCAAWATMQKPRGSVGVEIVPD
jgi:hypothetical protein